MKYMSGDDIRRTFLEFFQSKGHLILPSASLIPHGDPTLLLTNAGMVPFKPYFMGEATPPRRRLTTSQKCFRTVDIDVVGDERHLTFFEMLGNFSIGDYFKREAITFAWELLTSPQYFAMPADRLWPTIHPKDDEAFAPVARDHRRARPSTSCAWRTTGGDRPARPAPTGPTRRSTSIAARNSAAASPTASPAATAPASWRSGTWSSCSSTATPTARIRRCRAPASTPAWAWSAWPSCCKARARSTRPTSSCRIIAEAARLAGKTYGASEQIDYALRVIADHSRSVTFLIADGVLPSNEGRGYVLRRILRRAVRYGRELGLDEPFLTKTAAVVIDRHAEAVS